MIKYETNSKNIKKGQTFIAIKGHTVDGYKYIEDAIKNGASTVVVQNNKQYSVETINVDNTEKYLIDKLISEYANDFKDMKIIGITGTNGKTTTAYMTYQFLRKLNINASYIGTIGFYCNDTFYETNNTTPDILSLYNCLEICKENNSNIVLIEASSIGIKEQRLAGLKYDICVFTNLTHDHLDYHKTMKEYLKAKLELFDNLKEDGISITNTDDKYGDYFKIKKYLTYGFKNTDIVCNSYNDAFPTFSYTLDSQKYEIKSQLYGKYNVYNIMASILILKTLGIDIETINKIYPTLNPPKGRDNIINYNSNKIIIDYAHTPDGIKQILSANKVGLNGKMYVVFGCPGNRDRKKRSMMSRIVNKYADYFIITDDDPHYEDEMQIINDTIKGLVSDKYEIIVDRKEAIKKAVSLLKENDTLLILGKGHENCIIIKDKRIPHNDTEWVKELINLTK